jgi:hypothetical protein
MRAAMTAFGVLLLAFTAVAGVEPFTRAGFPGGLTVRAAQPAAAQPPAFSLAGSIPGPADLVDVHGDKAFIVAGSTLRVFDIANPVAPVRRGEYTFPEKIWGIRVVGSLVFVAADFFGLGILDVSNAEKPTLRGAVKTPGQAKNVAVVGSKAAVADHMSGVNFIDVSDVAKPVMLGSFFLEGYARDVASSGSMAYAVDSPAGVYAFDLSKPGEQEPVHSQQSATAPGSIVVSEDSHRIAVLVGGGSLQVYDVSKPAEPVKVAAFRTPGGRPVRAALAGPRAYVADGREGLQVVDLSTPATPRVVGSYRTPTPARDVAVAGSFVFVVVGAAAEEPREFKDQEVLILKHAY